MSLYQGAPLQQEGKVYLRSRTCTRCPYKSIRQALCSVGFASE